MAHLPINHSEEPIRLFKSDALEFFTHIHPAVVLLIWIPVSVYSLYRGVIGWPVNISPWVIFLVFFAGVFLWTLSEYLLHRFVFHFPARGALMERITFLFHGVHHAQPQCKTRLVMPPVVSIPMALIFFGVFYILFKIILGAGFLIYPVFSGFLTGYIIYDMTHYATHHFAMRTGYYKYIKRYHNQHHYKTPNKRFGVSSPVWDVVFGTKPE